MSNGLPKVIEENGKRYERKEVSTSLRVVNQYLSNQEHYGRSRDLYLVRECGIRLGIYKEIS